MRVFLDDGIDVRVGVAVARVDRDADGSLRVTLDDGGVVIGDDVLVAAGREPVTGGLGLDVAGVRLSDRGFVEVDDHLRTSAERTGRPETSPAARSSPTSRWTTTGSSGRTSRVASAAPPTGWSRTPSSPPPSWPGSG